MLDLRNLNRYIRKFPLRMLTLRSMIPSGSYLDWFADPDLKDAYFFVLGQEDHFHYKVFLLWPFHCTPVFTKCLLVVASFLRRQDIFIFPYLDNWLLKTYSEDKLKSVIHCMCSLFQRLGLLRNKNISLLFPKLNISFKEHFSSPK